MKWFINVLNDYLETQNQQTSSKLQRKQSHEVCNPISIKPHQERARNGTGSDSEAAAAIHKAS